MGSANVKKAEKQDKHSNISSDKQNAENWRIRTQEKEKLCALAALDSRQTSKEETIKVLGPPDLGSFEILRTIATESYSRTQLCFHKESKEYFALKMMQKKDIIRLRKTENVNAEKGILASIAHPFIVNMFWTHHDNTLLYILLEYVPGGELMTYIKKHGHFDTSMSTFYTCEIVSALEYLHSKDIMHRSLNPEIILIDKDGHLKITEFFVAKTVKSRTYTSCGIVDYVAPEIILNTGYTKVVDWWAMGCMFYEMLVGSPPFFVENECTSGPWQTYKNILEGKLNFPKHTESSARDLIQKLLTANKDKRLGMNGAEEIKSHKHFKDVNWNDVMACRLKPPIIPKLSHAGDTENYTQYAEDDWRTDTTSDDRLKEYFTDF